MKRMMRILKRIFPHPLNNAYYIGFLLDADMSLPVDERYSKIRWLDVDKCKTEGWFADPFIVSVSDNIVELFAEEMIYKTGRGVLVYLKVDIETCQILEKKSMLELDTHLSFPIYIKENGKIFVYPENYQSGSLKIYEYNELLKRLVHPRTIIEAPLLDTQIIKIEGEYYAFGVRFYTGTQKDTRKLYIYKSDSLCGHYELFQVIDNTKCEERGGGEIFQENGRLIRPAQSCEGGYGREVIFYELNINDAGFNEKEIERLIPDRSAKYGNVLHTFNKMNGWVVIDGWSYNHPILASIYSKIRGVKFE